jgi:hypothetical protein
MAQVYSVNVVGYVNVTIGAGQWAILANPLDNGDNTLATVLQPPTGATGLQVFTWQNQGFLGPAIYLEGMGWLDSDPPVSTFAPGNAFFALNVTAAPITLTFVGQVLQTPQDLSVTIENKGKWSFIASKIPIASNLGTPSDASSLQFPATTGDQVFMYDQAGQKYVDPYIYLEGMGWLSPFPDDPNVGGPTVPVANGFWVLRVADTGPNWTRTFTVQ